MTSEENEKAEELPEGDVSVPTYDLPRSDQFPDSSGTKCTRCDKMLTREEIDRHMKTANE